MMVRTSPYRPTAISLFAGAGGCSLGFGQAGYDVRFATDLDADAVESYRRNFPVTPCLATDVRQLTAEAVLQRIGLNAGELDILLGGPPCQGFSSAGVKAGDDPRNSLLSHYVRLLEGIRPKWFVMENVEGLLTSGGGLHVRDTVAAFLEAGYSLNLEKVYAQGYGIPQRRKRVHGFQSWRDDGGFSRTVHSSAANRDGKARGCLAGNDSAFLDEG